MRRSFNIFLKFLFADMYGKLLFILVTEHVYSDIVLFLNFNDLFNGYQKLDTVVIQLLRYYFVSLSDSTRIFIFIGIKESNVPQQKHSLCEFLILMSPFIWCCRFSGNLIYDDPFMGV